MTGSRERDLRVWSALVLTGAAGVLAVLYATVWGAGISPDSTRYVGAARALLAGQGITVLAGDGTPVPLTKWPPLLPLMLALPGLAGWDPLDAARWLNALAFGLNIFLVGALVFRLTGRRAASLLAAGLMLVSPDQLHIHAMAWTEPTFVLFVLAALTAWSAHAAKPRGLTFVLAAAAAACALLDRYAGVSIVAAVGFTAIMQEDRPPGRRLSDGLAFGLISCAPLAVWITRNLAATGDAASRSLAPNSLLPSQIPLGLDVLSGWLLPGAAPMLARTVALAAASLLVGISLVRGRTPADGDPWHEAAIRGLALFVACYLAFLAISVTLLDPPAVPVDYRLLGVIYPPMVILAVRAACRAAPREPRGFGLARGLLCGVLLAALVAGAGRTLPFLAESHIEGLEYASAGWKQSATMAAVNRLPAGTRIYTNGSDAIYALSGRPAYPLPPRRSAATGELNAGFAEQVGIVGEEMARHGGALVYFRREGWRTNMPLEADLAAILPLRIAFEGVDGAIYRLGD